MINQPSNTVAGNVVLANLPQLLISLLYLLYNDLVTRIHLAAQWSSYARTRKPLRVLNPRKDQSMAKKQRNYYVLSLPLRVSIPLLVLMMILHWLVSQSLFLGILGVLNYTGGGAPSDEGYPVLGLGYSPFAIILSLILGAVMILGLWVYAFAFKYDSGMPLVRSCSAAISAACHAPAWDVKCAEKPLLYGVVETPAIGLDGRGVHRHVCFTSGPAEPLVDGEIYS